MPLSILTADGTGTGVGAGTFIGVGVGVGVLLLLVLSIVVVLILMVMVVRRRKEACKQKRDAKKRDNLYSNNNVMQEKGKSAQTHYNDMHIYEEVDNDNDEEQDPTNDRYNPYEFDDSNENIQSTKTPVNVKESSTPFSITKAPVVYDTVTDSGRYARPRKAMDLLTSKWDEVVGSGSVEKGGHYYNVLELRYMVQADQRQQTNEGGYKNILIQ